MKYTVSFNFNCVSKRGAVSGRSGEIDIDTDIPLEGLKTDSELIQIIADEMMRKTRKSIMSVNITKITEQK